LVFWPKAASQVFVGGSAEKGRGMEGFLGDSSAVAFLTALITPAIVLLACANLITGCHMRLSRVMDRVRTLAQLAEDIRLGKTTDHAVERRKEISAQFHFYERRGKMILVSLSFLYGTVGLFVATSMAVAVDLLLGSAVSFIPVVLSIVGISLFLISSLLMMYENRIAFKTMRREIQFVHMLEEAVFHFPENMETRTEGGKS
ncbi:MAG: DUF2721 domain-containing protein, partial [Acidiferrobacterales bacterium]